MHTANKHGGSARSNRPVCRAEGRLRAALLLRRVASSLRLSVGPCWWDREVPLEARRIFRTVLTVSRSPGAFYDGSVHEPQTDQRSSRVQQSWTRTWTRPILYFTARTCTHAELQIASPDLTRTWLLFDMPHPDQHRGPRPDQQAFMDPPEPENLRSDPGPERVCAHVLKGFTRTDVQF